MNELVQEFSTYLIISGTSIYTIYKLVQFFFSSQNKGSCTGCSGGSCGLSSAKHLPKRLTLPVKQGLSEKSSFRIK